MNINIKDTLLLSDNNEYVVINKLNYNDKTYLFLVSKNMEDIKFCYQDNDEVVLVENSDTIKNLMALFLKDLVKQANEVSSN